MNAKEFLSHFRYNDDLYLALCIGDIYNAKFVREIPELPEDRDVYFGPALRKNPGNMKEDVHGSITCWVDADDPQKPLATLPPSIAVFSGHGWHLYWLLHQPIEEFLVIEQLNKVLATDVPTGDRSTWNVNRVLRVPGTTNNKEPDKPVKVALRFTNPVSYSIADIRVLETLDNATRHKIRTGDTRGYRSRSERDWSIITKLVEHNASDELIEMIFRLQPCGDKAKDSNAGYIAHTIERARARGGGGEQPGTRARDAMGGMEERDDGYYTWSRRGSRRISTFVIHPEILLDGSEYGAEDAIVGSVTSGRYKWENTSFNRDAFNSVQKMDKQCPIIAWQWLGRDEDVRALLPYLLTKLEENGLPKVSASPTLGLHMISGIPYFIGDKQTLGAESFWEGYGGPIAWLPNHREHPEMDLATQVDERSLDLLRTHIVQLNTPDVVWPMIGWYGATPLKPWFESQGYRFPILNVVGTKGSGKTTLIQRIFMPLLGQTDPKSYDAGTTRFVTLALMGSSNAIPVAFSEFRYDAVEKFIRFVLLSYDTGHDPRGRGDQSTVDYPLSAPFSVDGEDMLEDPAAKERIVVAHLRPKTVAEGSESYNAYARLRDHLPKGFGGFFVQQLLKQLSTGELEHKLRECRADIFDAFPSRLPDRVRQNHIVVYAGAKLFSEIVGIAAPTPETFAHAITTVYDLATGRSKNMSDFMVEDVINECSRGSSAFKWTSVNGGGTLYFQLSSAHSWWLTTRRKQGRGALERDAIRSQVKEAPYYLGTSTHDNCFMYGVDLGKAQELGLDIPSNVNHREFKVSF